MRSLGLLGATCACGLWACSAINSPAEPILHGSGSGAGAGLATVSTATGTSSTSANGAGGGMMMPKCGDGKLGGTEQCDDGKESATCNADCTKANCGDMKLNATAGEQCDEGAMQTATCEITCKKPVCGDGTVNLLATEECEPGLADACCDAGCKALATCAAPQAITLTPMGASQLGKIACAATALKQVPSAVCGNAMAMAGAGSDRVFKLTVPSSSAVTIKLDATFDGMLRLLAKPCDLATEQPGGAADGSGCVNATMGKGVETLSYPALCAGDYFLVVDGVGDMDAGTFTLDVELKPTTNPIVNGGFENAYQGWTIQQLLSPQAMIAGIAKNGQQILQGQPVQDFAKMVTMPAQGPQFPNVYQATEGTSVAFYSESGPGDQHVFQDVIVSGCTLKFDISWKNYAPQGFQPNQFVAVNLRDPATNMILDQPLLTKAVDPMMQQLMKPIQFDMKKYVNKKIRVEVETYGNNGFLHAAYDNFRIE